MMRVLRITVLLSTQMALVFCIDLWYGRERGIKMSELTAADMPMKQIDVFISGTDGYHTYRIPAIVITNKGTLLAFCEGRKKSSADHGDIEIVLKRSFDGGETWNKMQIVWDEGENTVGNPCPAVDRTTGTIWLPFCLNNDRVFVTCSDDDGVTWSTPREITKDVKPHGWGWYATGPGHGIQLKSGRLLIPCDHGEGNEIHSHVIYSDDHGATWTLGGSLPPKTDECQAVEMPDGSIYLNMRSNHGKNRRAYAWSTDGGITWSEVKHDDALIEPVCQASLVRFEDKVLFSNPACVKRQWMTVRVSRDQCKTWSAGKVIYPGPAAYSDLCILPNSTVCCLFERGMHHPYEKITLARFILQFVLE